MNQNVIKEHLDELEELRIDISCSASAICALQEAVEDGCCGARLYSDALYSLYKTFLRHGEELGSHINAMFHEVGMRTE